MNNNLKRKLELTSIGCLFTLLNLTMNSYNFPIVGIFFGVVSIFFYIKALSIKNEKNN